MLTSETKKDVKRIDLSKLCLKQKNIYQLLVVYIVSE